MHGGSRSKIGHDKHGEDFDLYFLEFFEPWNWRMASRLFLPLWHYSSQTNWTQIAKTPAWNYKYMACFLDSWASTLGIFLENGRSISRNRMKARWQHLASQRYTSRRGYACVERLEFDHEAPFLSFFWHFCRFCRKVDSQMGKTRQQSTKFSIDTVYIPSKLWETS